MITLNEAELNAEGARRRSRSSERDKRKYRICTKFLINDDDMMTVTLRNYSADQNCVWVPREAEPTKSVCCQKRPPGRYDAIDSFTVTVE